MSYLIGNAITDSLLYQFEKSKEVDPAFRYDRSQSYTKSGIIEKGGIDTVAHQRMVAVPYQSDMASVTRNVNIILIGGAILIGVVLYRAATSKKSPTITPKLFSLF